MYIPPQTPLGYPSTAHNKHSFFLFSLPHIHNNIFEIILWKSLHLTKISVQRYNYYSVLTVFNYSLIYFINVLISNRFLKIQFRFFTKNLIFHRKLLTKPNCFPNKCLSAKIDKDNNIL